MTTASTVPPALARFSLAGRVALVTGGSRGIGGALAMGLAQAGAAVVVSSRKPDACNAVAAEVEAAGGRALAVPAHMGDLAQVAALVERAADHFGQLDIVVNNAANALAQPIGQITPDAWAKTQDTNLRGPLFLVQQALPLLEASPGASIVNVISVVVYTSGAFVAMYNAAKAGLLALTRSMAAELAPKGIRANALAPGSVDTDMTRNNGPAAMARMAEACLLKRVASPEEMVGPLLFLVSDAASYVTGQVVVADGGLTFH